MVICPECESDLDIEEDEVDEGEIVSCPECGSDFEVVAVEPLELSAWKTKKEKKTRKRKKKRKRVNTNSRRGQADFCRLLPRPGSFLGLLFALSLTGQRLPLRNQPKPPKRTMP